MKELNSVRYLEFEGLGPCMFARVSYREPKKGEYYLSGSVPQAYKAPNDLTSAYQIVIPTYKAVRVELWVKGEPIK